MEGKALYIAFFGYYPVFKSFIEQRRLPRAAEWVLKLLVFNTATVAAYLIMLRFFGLDPQSFTIGGVPLPWVFLLLGNGVFVLYDCILPGSTPASGGCSGFDPSPMRRTQVQRIGFFAG